MMRSIMSDKDGEFNMKFIKSFFLPSSLITITIPFIGNCLIIKFNIKIRAPINIIT